MINQTTQHIKNDIKEKTVIPLICGIVSLMSGSVSITPVIILFAKGFLPHGIYRLSIFSIIGVISGIIGLKSSKKIISIFGMILSVIGLLIGIFFFLIRLGFEMEG